MTPSPTTPAVGTIISIGWPPPSVGTTPDLTLPRMHLTRGRPERTTLGPDPRHRSRVTVTSAAAALVEAESVKGYTTGARECVFGLSPLTSTLGLAAASWAVAVRADERHEHGRRDPARLVRLFIVLWISMMAAMMLPGAAPASRGGPRPAAVCAPFRASSLRTWPSGQLSASSSCLLPAARTVAAGAVVIAAGCLRAHAPQAHFRRRCRDSVRSGFEFGLCCVGSSIGLMLVLVALTS